MAVKESGEDFKIYLEDTMANDTTNGVDELTKDPSPKKDDGETVSALLQHFQSIKSELEESFDKEKLNMEDNFEHEKTDIVKGFLIEKKILAKEHEREKQTLINSFIAEREKMLENFQHQVKDIESKMKTNYYSEKSLSSEAKPLAKKRYAGKELNEPFKHDVNKLLIKVDDKNLISPEEFIKNLEIEEKFEAEKDSIEKSFRQEKDKIKKRAENDYITRLQKEKQKHEAKTSELLKDIQNLRHAQEETENMWKTQATRLEQQFQKERQATELRHKTERDKLRKKLEEKHSVKFAQQQSEYDRNINELKTELRKIKKDFEYLKDENSSKENTIALKNEIAQQLNDNFHRETKVIREQNEKLNNDVKHLTSEKYELQKRIRELESQNDNDSALLKEYTDKVNKEYEYKMKRLITQCERLKVDLHNKEKETRELNKRLSSFETCEKNMEGRLTITEQTVRQCEDTINTMRSENTNLSHEINLLRGEKEDLQKHLERQQNTERQMKVAIKKSEDDYSELSNRHIILEREKLQQEKMIADVRKDLEKTNSMLKEKTEKIKNLENELHRQRQLLDGETKENKRLHERFNQDAELLRRKDAENLQMRRELENIKSDFETLKNKMQTDNDRIMNIESEKIALLNQMERIKKTESLQKKHEIIAVQNSYVKEFAKRLEFVKANYEREIKSLKQQIEDLKSPYINSNEYVKYDQNGKTRLNIVTSSFQDLPTRDLGLDYQLKLQKTSPSISEEYVSNRNSEQSLKLPTTQKLQSTNAIPPKHIYSHQPSAFYPVHENMKQTPVKLNPSPDVTSTLNLPRTEKPINSAYQTQLTQTNPGYPILFPDNRSNSQDILQRIYSYMHTSTDATDLPTDREVLVNSNTSKELSENASNTDKFSPNSCFSQIGSESKKSLNKPGKESFEQTSIKSSHGKPHQSKGVTSHANLGIHQQITSPYSADSGIVNSEAGSLRCPPIPVDNNKVTIDNQDVINIFSRIHDAEKNSDNDELRMLLKDVRKEVLLLNKLMDERTPNSTPRNSMTPDSSFSNSSTKNRKTRKDSKTSETEIRRLNEQNIELQKRLDEQERRMMYQEVSCEELQNRRILLEKLVDRLQNRLREETSKRRQIEQCSNVIPEDSKEGLDDSTV